MYIREDFDVYENAALVKSNVTEYEDARKRKRKRKVPPDKTREGDTEFCSWDNFKINTYCVIVDRLIAELDKRKTVYDELSSYFNFFTKGIIMDRKEIFDNALC